MEPRSVAIGGGKFKKGPLPEVALPGYWLLPGIVDIFSDPGAITGGPRQRLTDYAGRAAAVGITTAHLAQDWSWEGGAGSPEQALITLRAAGKVAPGPDLRIFLRVETHLPDATDLLRAVRRHGVGAIGFRNSVSEALEQSKVDPDRFALRAAAAGRTVEAHFEALRTARRQAREVPRQLCRLAAAFDALGLVYGSLCDPDAETREFFSMIGARPAIFPLSRKAAAAARAMNDPVVLAAADIVAERPAAIDLLRGGKCTALAGGHRPEELVPAVLWIVKRGLMPLAEAWALISTSPAEILRLPDRGQIAIGRRADLTVVNAATGAVEATISAGRLIHATGRAGAALAAVPEDPLRMAAE